jgi:SNF2 family DNA or RNA helicase
MTGQENNLIGNVVKVFMITQSGAEGISLANVRQVHIMEPYWNYVRLDQVKGRAIRICSHMDLPPEERTVDVFTYISKFSQKQIKDRAVIETLMNFDEGKSTDEQIFSLLKAKKKLADSILDTMKQSAVDCELNATENGTLACYRFAGVPSMEPLFHPLVDVHVTEAEAAIRAAV